MVEAPLLSSGRLDIKGVPAGEVTTPGSCDLAMEGRVHEGLGATLGVGGVAGDCAMPGMGGVLVGFSDAFGPHVYKSNLKSTSAQKVPEVGCAKNSREIMICDLI